MLKKTTVENVRDDNVNIKDIDTFFNASSIAIVGASPSENKLSHTIQKNMMTSGYKGKIYPINPKYKEILGIDAFPDIRSIPGKLDLVIVLVSLEDMHKYSGTMQGKRVRKV